ncbi:MAG: flavodoxin family protein [Candidatus Omnitrophota bacterium]|nr:flavodoxin family protein [Candidatus Omnitrophota bacterium]
MHVLGISGSPKKKGFTNLLLDEALDGARAAGAQTDKIILNDLSFKPCQECWGCKDTGVCVHNDDMKMVYQKIKDADHIIIASPIYFSTITAQLKMMIDRCNSLWMARRKEGGNIPSKTGRNGAFICVAGEDKKEYLKNAKSVLKALFATIGIVYSKELFVGGIDKMTESSPKRKDALLKSYELGASIVQFPSRGRLE